MSLLFDGMDTIGACNFQGQGGPQKALKKGAIELLFYPLIFLVP